MTLNTPNEVELSFSFSFFDDEFRKAEGLLLRLGMTFMKGVSGLSLTRRMYCKCSPS